MALTWFWRCEGTTLDGTHDFTDGTDTTATANGSVAINGTAALVGSNGIQTTGAAQHYRFDSEVTNYLTGSYGLWVRPQTWAASVIITSIGGSYVDRIAISLDGIDEISLLINEDSNPSTLTSAGSFGINTTYFVTASWDQPNSLRRIRVYDSAGNQLDETTSSAGFTAPSGALNAGNGLRIGECSGQASALYLDNIFIGDAYDDADTFLANRAITSYTDYDPGAGPVTNIATISRVLLLRQGQA